ncbi:MULTISPECIES: F0F1 ATP synthase subunit B [unclassified Caulobacter]|uniref:F0F1 ATP synthase subunit B n=1 Tax=unclassified Caulobacter TaxID=2648921 RepID=UPI000D33EBDA|nr:MULTISPECIES: F0F1 ATP synthase subunit B [unclassified Caulobacter]PTS87101.1 ATP F0F1 synthase subunit B [Caulobacter sp. HMWF009]PTT10525.1 ATP F0F1 synthase subunit B [Caulobacter sp. HMWF025]
MEHESLFNLSNPEFWVLVALVLFFGLLVVLKVLPGALFGALDGYAAKIKAELDEAQQLREEAQALLVGVKAQREDAERQAAGMIEAAKVDAARMAVEAKEKLEEQIKRRAEMAERKIAQAEAQAAADVKAAAVDLAAQAAEAVLSARLAGLKSDPLVDAAIGQMGAKLQ